MRTIDMETWSRRQHFDLFSSYGYPHWGMCANVDITAFYPWVKQGGHSLTVAIVYLIARTSNDIPEFRYRIRGSEVIEHEMIHPAFTFLSTEEAFSFCFTKYEEDFSSFATSTEARIDSIRDNPTVSQLPGDDVIYMSSIPWVSFTGFLHPMRLQPEDTIPRFVWGKFFEEGDRLKMPLGVQGHHALVDGLHVGRYYQLIQKHLDQPQVVLG